MNDVGLLGGEGYLPSAAPAEYIVQDRVDFIECCLEVLYVVGSDFAVISNGFSLGYQL